MKIFHLKPFILLEFSFKNLKWLCIGVYKAPPQNDKYFLDNPSKNLGKLIYQYDKTMLIGDFNLTVENKNVEISNLECKQTNLFPI